MKSVNGRGAREEVTDVWPFDWFKRMKAEKERLHNEYKRKISEAHLAMMSGDLSTKDLTDMCETLKSIKHYGTDKLVKGK